MTHEKLCTVREVAQTLDVSVATVHRWINLGIISAFRIHKTVRISEGVLQQLLADACAGRRGRQSRSSEDEPMTLTR